MNSFLFKKSYGLKIVYTSRIADSKQANIRNEIKTKLACIKRSIYKARYFQATFHNGPQYFLQAFILINSLLSLLKTNEMLAYARIFQYDQAEKKQINFEAIHGIQVLSIILNAFSLSYASTIFALKNLKEIKNVTLLSSNSKSSFSMVTCYMKVYRFFSNNFLLHSRVLPIMLFSYKYPFTLFIYLGHFLISFLINLAFVFNSNLLGTENPFTNVNNSAQQVNKSNGFTSSLGSRLLLNVRISLMKTFLFYDTFNVLNIYYVFYHFTLYIEIFTVYLIYILDSSTNETTEFKVYILIFLLFSLFNANLLEIFLRKEVISNREIHIVRKLLEIIKKAISIGIFNEKNVPSLSSQTV